MEKYNGWTNWDTWNAHLWLSNDEYTYNVLRLNSEPDGFEELATGLIRDMGNRDGIDFGYVNWEEVRQAFVEDDE